MISEALFAEFCFIIFIYFRYFGNVLFISYNPSSLKNWEYQQLAAELQRQLPDYSVHYGYIRPPTVFLLAVILVLHFYFEGLHKLILKFFAMNTKKQLITTGLLVLLTLMCLIDAKNDFGISYEGSTIYSMESPDMEIPNVDQLVDIIKEKAQGVTFPRAVSVAIFLIAIQPLGRPRRRR